MYHTPLERFLKVDCSTTKRVPIVPLVPIPNDTSSESSRRVVSNVDLFGHRHYSNCGDIEHGKSAQGGVSYCTQYTVPGITVSCAARSHYSVLEYIVIILGADQIWRTVCFCACLFLSLPTLCLSTQQKHKVGIGWRYCRVRRPRTASRGRDGRCRQPRRRRGFLHDQSSGQLGVNVLSAFERRAEDRERRKSRVCGAVLRSKYCTLSIAP